MDCTTYVAKTKALISCAVTAQKIVIFCFLIYKSMFSHDMAKTILMAHSVAFEQQFPLMNWTYISIFSSKLSKLSWDPTAPPLGDNIDRCNCTYIIGALLLEKWSSVFPTRSDTNQSVQPQKVARALKFRI